MKTRVILAVVVIVVLGGVGFWWWNRPSVPPMFLGYYGDQPPLVVALLVESSEENSVPRVVQAAKLFRADNAPSDDYWPEPVHVSERDTFWWVKFEKKKKVFRERGVEVIQGELPGMVCIQVEKADMACRWVPTR